MRSSCYLFVIAVVGFPALISANNTTPLEEETVTLPVPTTPKPLCKEQICPRIYMPVCGLVDGQLMTAPSICDLNNKIKCSLLLRKSLGKKVPIVRFLHSGPCSAKKDKSTVVRMRRALDNGSNDELAEAEVEGKNESDGLGDSIEVIISGASAEDGDDLGESGESNEIAASDEKAASDEHAENENSGSEEEAEAKEAELIELALKALGILDADDEDEADMKEAEADDAQAGADLAEELADSDEEDGDDIGDHDDEDHDDEDDDEDDDKDEGSDDAEDNHIEGVSDDDDEEEEEA